MFNGRHRAALSLYSLADTYLDFLLFSAGCEGKGRKTIQPVAAGVACRKRPRGSEISAMMKPMLTN
jgi:hypothetical protein